MITKDTRKEGIEGCNYYMPPTEDKTAGSEPKGRTFSRQPDSLACAGLDYLKSVRPIDLKPSQEITKGDQASWAHLRE